MNSKLLTLLLSVFVVSASALADLNVTHYGKIEFKLSTRDSAGKDSKIASSEADINIDWTEKKCNIVSKDYSYPCTLDLSQDLKNASGELLMRAIPQVLVSQQTLDTIIQRLGNEDKKLKLNIRKLVSDTSQARKDGQFVPFYTCGECEKNGKDLLLFNVFQSFVKRDLEINHSSLGSGRKLVLSSTLSKMKPVKGAFNIIGNNNQGSFSH